MRVSRVFVGESHDLLHLADSYWRADQWILTLCGRKIFGTADYKRGKICKVCLNRSTVSQ